jgi:hypothetical protein
MAVEYSAVEHGGLELALSGQIQIPTVTSSSIRDTALVAHDAPQLALNKPEDAPEVFAPGTEPKYAVDKIDELLEIPDDKTAEVAAPANDNQKPRNNKNTIIVGITLLLVIIIIGLGVGLGVALGVKHTSDCLASIRSKIYTDLQVSSPLSTNTPTSTTTSAPSVSSSSPDSTGGIINPPSPTGSNVATGQDVSFNDQLTPQHIATWFYTGQTATQVSQLCTQNNARLTQIRVDNGTVPTFTVIMIESTGIYSSESWWYGPDSYNQGNNFATRRIICIDPYYDASGSLQFALVQIPKLGSRIAAGGGISAKPLTPYEVFWPNTMPA